MFKNYPTPEKMETNTNISDVVVACVDKVDIRLVSVVIVTLSTSDEQL